MERKSYVIATAEGSELTALGPGPGDGAFHASADVYLNGNPFPEALVHTYRSELGGPWQPATLRIQLSAIDKIGRFPLLSFADHVQDLEIDGLDQPEAALYVSCKIRVPPQYILDGTDTQFGSFYASLGETAAPAPRVGGSEKRAKPRTGRTPESVHLLVNIGVSFQRDEWTNPWSIKTWRRAFRTCAASIAHNVQSEPAASDERNAESLLVSFAFTTPLAEAVKPALDIAGRVIAEATALARATLDEGKLIQYFEFPTATKAACEQYLVYFSQFLRDLGIESTSQIKEEANRVLFSVEPADGKEALATVREALAIYLNLPALSEAQRAALGDGGIAALQLQSNVQHLQAQLVLAKATMQLQQATIYAHERALDAQARTLRLLEDAGSKMAKPSESEPILGDLVRVTPIKGRGLEINLPALVRRLKRKDTPS